MDNLLNLLRDRNKFDLHKRGIYMMYYESYGKELQYIGYTNTCFFNRWRSHISYSGMLGKEKRFRKNLKEDFNPEKIRFMILHECDDLEESKILEMIYIRDYQPEINRVFNHLRVINKEKIKKYENRKKLEQSTY